MKKIAIIMAALLLVGSIVGCGQKNNNTVEENTTTTQQQTDASSAYGGTADFTPEQIDMDKIQGDELKSDTDKKDYSGKLGDVEVTISDAKVIDYNGEKVAIVSYEYTNNSDADMPFTGSLKTEAYQNDDRLVPTVVSGVEGVTMLGLSENVAPGKTLTVQEAYRLRDDSAPIVVEVFEFYQNEDSTVLSKVFEF